MKEKDGTMIRWGTGGHYSLHRKFHTSARQ